MSFESLLRKDLLDPSLLVNPYEIRVVAQKQYDYIISSAIDTSKTTSLNPAKDINDIAELIYKAIQDYETRTHATNDAKVNIVYEYPDMDFDAETISICYMHRVPGAYSQGGAGEGNIKNRRPILREQMKDPDNPGYRRSVMGFYYDNIIRLIAWARTNKVANNRAVWLENVMEEYSWFFAFSGVNRILFEGWRPSETITINNNTYFGRPIDFFVRTEKLFNISEKELEQICIRLIVSTT